VTRQADSSDRLPFFLLLLLLLRLAHFRIRFGWRQSGGFLKNLRPLVIHGGPHQHIDGKALPGMALVNATHGGNIPIVPTVSHPDML
jgi:hypothetical protein